jgi:hypothetical protein
MKYQEVLASLLAQRWASEEDKIVEVPLKPSFKGTLKPWPHPRRKASVFDRAVIEHGWGLEVFKGTWHSPFTPGVYIRSVRRYAPEAALLSNDLLAAGFGEEGQLGISPTHMREILPAWGRWLEEGASTWRLHTTHNPGGVMGEYGWEQSGPDIPRLGVSGSTYCPSAKSLLVHFLAGTAVKDVPATSDPSWQAGGRKEARLKASLYRKLRRPEQYAPPFATLGLGELTRLNRLSGAFLRWVYCPSKSRREADRVRWNEACARGDSHFEWAVPQELSVAEMAKKQEAWIAISKRDRALCQKAQIPASNWRAGLPPAHQLIQDPAMLTAWLGSTKAAQVAFRLAFGLDSRPLGAEWADLRHPASEKVVKQILNMAREGHVQDVLPALRLAQLFRKPHLVSAYLEKWWDGATEGPIHDGGQFMLPRQGDWTRNLWANLAQRFGPEVLTYGAIFSVIEKELGRVPRSLGELRKIKLVATSAISILAVQYKLDSQSVEEYATLMLGAVPGPLKDGLVLSSEGELALSVLPHKDPLGPMLGLATGCCQHLGSAGKACAKHGVESPLGGFLVVRKVTTGEIMAQSWYWVAPVRGETPGIGPTPYGLCLDSVEGYKLSRAKLEPLYRKAAEMLRGRGFGLVTTGSSIGTRAQSPLRLEGYTGYSDAHRQSIL